MGPEAFCLRIEEVCFCLKCVFGWLRITDGFTVNWVRSPALQAAGYKALQCRQPDLKSCSEGSRIHVFLCHLRERVFDLVVSTGKLSCQSELLLPMNFYFSVFDGISVLIP